MKNKGIWFAVGCYIIWGVFPLYWRMLEAVPAVQTVAHRQIWSFVFLGLVLLVSGQWRGLPGLINRRTLLIYFASGMLLTINWLVYIYGVNAGFVIETSLGYFINPLVSVMFGVVFFGEKLPFSKWIPIGLAALGVAYLTVTYGQLPWIALALAFTFGLYGLVKKLSPLGALYGLTLETSMMFPIALGYLVFSESQGVGQFFHAGPQITILLILCGAVTAVPLLLFSSAAKNIPLSMIGILQYIAPTLQFITGVFIFHEAFSRERLAGFCIIWSALILFSLSGIYERRKALAATAAAS
jgi:chloramphenicol-sensitive protein RarD